MQQRQASPVLSLASSSSPSFNSSYSNSSLADIAARVVEEFRAENENDDDSEFLYVGDLFCGLGGEASEEAGDLGKEDIAAKSQDEEQNNDDGDEEEFEFAFVPRDAEELLLNSADQIFYNGQIRPVFPIFNRNYWEAAGNNSMCNSSSLLMSSCGDEQQKVSATPQTIRLPLRKLLSEDQETPPSSSSSCSSSEADELEGIPEGTYCVWRPKAAKESPGKCKKSNSTGWSSKRWRLRDLVHHRSNSDGKETFVFLTPSFRKGEDKAGPSQTSKTAGKSKPNLTAATHYTKNRGDKRRSYLPYRQDIVGFFANVNGISRNLQPF